MHARFIFRGGESWQSAYAHLPEWSAPDHPLLIPVSIARLWSFAGTDSMIIPWLIAFVFTFGTVVLAVSAVGMLRSRSQGLLAGAVLLGTANLVRFGSGLCADVPLGFCVLAVIVLLTIQQWLAGRSRGPVFLAGVMAGLAVWTKNEGLIFLLAVILVHVWKWRKSRAEVLTFCAGLLPALLVFVHFKIYLAPPSVLFKGVTLEAVQSGVASLDRWQAVLRYVARKIGLIGNGFPVVLAVYALLLGGTRAMKKPRGVPAGWATVGIVLCGYCTMYVVCCEDPSWLLAVSFERLLLHIWPSAVFLLFMSLPTPEGQLSTDAAVPETAEGMRRVRRTLVR
jgi:hypothetical protein